MLYKSGGFSVLVLKVKQQCIVSDTEVHSHEKVCQVLALNQRKVKLHCIAGDQSTKYEKGLQLGQAGDTQGALVREWIN